MLHCPEMKQYHLHLGSLAVTSQPQHVQHPDSRLSSKGWAEVVCLPVLQMDYAATPLQKASPGFCQWPVLLTPGYCIYINVKFFQVQCCSFVPSVACSALCCKGNCCGVLYFLQLLLSFAVFLLCWTPFLSCIGSSWLYCGSCSL